MNVKSKPSWASLQRDATQTQSVALRQRKSLICPSSVPISPHTRLIEMTRRFSDGILSSQISAGWDTVSAVALAASSSVFPAVTCPKSFHLLRAMSDCTSASHALPAFLAVVSPGLPVSGNAVTACS